MARPEDHDERMARARLSLEGLSVGDAFGEGFFAVPVERWQQVHTLRAERTGWGRFTDDTVMAISIVETLDEFTEIDQDDLARRFAMRYVQDDRRGYGGMAHGILQAIANGAAWQEVSRRAFDGAGSLGNGGAMRAAPIGAYFADDLEKTVDAARRSAEITHAHPEGQAGAIAVAVAAAAACGMHGAPEAGAGGELLAVAIEFTPPGPTRDGLLAAADLPRDAPVERAVELLGNGCRVTAPDTVPFALWCAARHWNDYVEAMWTTVTGSGDIDTNCAIVGGIVALIVGIDGIPAEWRDRREPLLPALELK